MSQPGGQFIADYQQRIAEVAAQAQAARARIAGVHGTETSGDGSVTVTVNVQGGLEDVRFGPAASSLTLDVLASTIVATSRKARVRAARAAADAVEPLLGADSAAMAEVRSRIPTEAPDGADGRPDRDGLNEENQSTTPPPVPPVAPADDADADESGYTRGF